MPPIYNPPGLAPPVPLADLEQITGPAYVGRASGTGVPLALTPPWATAPIPLSDLEQIAQAQLVGRAAGSGTGVPTVLAPPTVDVPMFQWVTIAMPNTAITFFGAIVASWGTLSTENLSHIVSPVAGSIVRLQVFSAAALANDDVTFTVRVNGAGTSLSAVLLHGTTAIGASGSVALAVGDRVAVEGSKNGTNSGASAALRIGIAVRLPTLF